MNGREKLAFDFIAACEQRLAHTIVTRQQKDDLIAKGRIVGSTLLYDGPFQPGTRVEMLDEERRGKYDQYWGCDGTVLYLIRDGVFMVQYNNGTGAWATNETDLRLPPARRKRPVAPVLRKG